MGYPMLKQKGENQDAESFETQESNEVKATPTFLGKKLRRNVDKTIVTSVGMRDHGRQALVSHLSHPLYFDGRRNPPSSLKETRD